MSQSSQLRVGVVGCGYVATRCHIPSLRRVPGLTIAAVADPDPARRALLGSDVRQYDRWEQLVDDPELEIILVASPSDSHAEIGSRALGAGKHLFVEKPLALALDGADRLCEARRAAQRLATVGLYLRFLPLMQALRKAMPWIGTVTSGHSSFHNHVTRRHTVSGYERRRTTGGGALYDLAYHHFDLYAWVLGASPMAVECRLRSVNFEDDVAATHLTLSNGVVVSGSFSSTTYNENHITLYGTSGKVEADMYRAARPEIRTLGEGNGRRISRNVWSAMRTAGLVTNVLPHVRLRPFVRHWTAFRDAIRGRNADLPTLEDGRAALKVVLAAYASASSGRQYAL